MPAAHPQPQPDRASHDRPNHDRATQDQPTHDRPPKSHIYSLEAAGILIIGAVVLILILTRYWHHIAWGVR